MPVAYNSLSYDVTFQHHGSDAILMMVLQRCHFFQPSKDRGFGVRTAVAEKTHTQ